MEEILLFNISELVKKGKNDFIKVYIKSMDDTISLSPLSRREWEEVESIETLAMKDIENVQKSNDSKNWKERQRKKKQALESEVKLKMNVHDQLVQQIKARTRAIFISASKNDQNLTEKEVKELQTPIFEEIYEKVLEISGITETEEEQRQQEEEIEKFH